MKRTFHFLILLICMPCWAQFSKITYIRAQNNDGTQAGFFTSPFDFKVGANCTWSLSGSVITLNCTGGGGTAHNLLSATHSDTTAASAVRGDMIAAFGATPLWTRIAHSSATGGYWKWNGTDVVASTGAAGGTGACTNQVVTTENADAAPTCSTVTSAMTSGTFTATAHNLLSAIHGDTTAASATRGDGIFALGASPKWAVVAHSGATGGYFKWNGTDMVASTGAAAGTGSCTNQVVTSENADAAPTCTTLTSAYTSGTFTATAHNLLSAIHGDATAGTVARGDVITGQGGSPTWTRLAKGTANQVLSMDGTATDVIWANAGSGTVTSVATTSPITGGTITSTGTIACATCATTANGGALTATSPMTISAAGVIARNAETEFCPFGCQVTGTGISPGSANQIRMSAFYLPYSITVSNITVNVVTADNVLNTDWGVYDSGGNLKLNVGAHTSASTGAVTIAATQGSTTLTPGLYYFALTGVGTTIALGRVSATSFTHLGNTASSTSSSLGVLPGTASIPADSISIAGQEIGFWLR